MFLENTMEVSTLASLESKIRPILTKHLPPAIVVKTYSAGRLAFLKKFYEEKPEAYQPPFELGRTLWGIRFRSLILNAAGMFKNGEGYELTARQGAAAHLWGTTTALARRGNEKDGVYLPFVPYPRSHTASNYLGLPNEGDEANAARLARQERLYDCPIGVSVMGAPELSGNEKIEKLFYGMRLYERAGADFIEMNESCPNTSHGKPQEDDLARRLQYVKEHFLDQRLTTMRKRPVPVIVKFSTDMQREQIQPLLDLLFEQGYDGVNFGNTSTAYDSHLNVIDPAERALYQYFTTTFGGGVSGRPLKKRSLEIAAAAVEYLKAGPPKQEFHVIRTGGIEDAADLHESDQAGISLNGWFTGYFENFSRYKHEVYKRLYQHYIG